MGATVGGVAGARIASAMIRDFGEFAPMPVAAALLLLFMLVLNVVNLRESGRTAASVKKDAEAPLGSEGGFQLVLKHRYLLLIGLLTLAVQIANTNGNYILDQTLTESARAAAGTSAGLSERQFIGAFRAEMDFYQNILVVLIQFFLVAHLQIPRRGRRAVHPAVARAHHYGAFAAWPVLALIRIGKIAENATDYSLQNTLRRALFLPTSREAKDKALQAVETFFWRAGDMLSAITVLVVVQILGLGVRGFALINLAIVALWLLIGMNLKRENQKLTRPDKVAA